MPQEQLVSLYDRVSDRDMKEQLIFVFQQRGSGPAFEKLLDIGRNEKDKDLRSKAVFWLSRSKDPRDGDGSPRRSDDATPRRSHDATPRRSHDATPGRPARR